jgi:uncharacterized protein
MLHSPQDPTCTLVGCAPPLHSRLSQPRREQIRWGAYRNIGARTEESCTQYNTLKVARHLFTWSADTKLADYYERALLNGVLGNQNVSGGMAESLEYMLPMGGAPGPYEPSGIYKPWASATDGGFPCCWGTLAESFAKLSDSIYFRSPDGITLFINLFESSTVVWNGLNVSQTATFPVDLARTTTIAIFKSDLLQAAGNTTIAVRVPFWATGDNSVRVNGELVPAAQLRPSSYVMLTRSWTVGDEVVVQFPLSLRFEQIDDPRA